MNSEQLSIVHSALNKIIFNAGEQQIVAKAALERMKPTPEQYKEASCKYAITTYILGVLNFIMEIAEKGNADLTENYIRFYAYQIGVFGTPDGSDVISQAQKNLKDILDYLITEFIEK